MYGQPCADSVDMNRGQREGVGVPSAPLGHHVPGEYADRRARTNGRMCTPADHGAGAKAAVIYIGEGVPKGGAEEGWEGVANVHVEVVGGSENFTRFW